VSSAQLAKFAKIKPADIEWRDGLPYSREFDDIYFAPEDGLAESSYVFIEGNELLNDWTSRDQAQFFLAELGFGSGLNFLITAALWRDQIAANADFCDKKLHYVSIEKRPLTQQDFKRASAHWPQFADIADQLAEFYPSLTYGRHQIKFHSLNLTLTLFLMPVEDALNDLIAESSFRQAGIQFDHWYLDGFAPAKNASMWGENLCKQIASLSKTGTRLATFSVAAAVKNPLKATGFQLKKRKGFGRKREMLTAVMTARPQSSCKPKYINLKYDKPWFKRSSLKTPQKVAIIGSGIAGCATARALAQEGVAVELFDAGSQLASGASGAAAGIFHPQLTSDMNLGSQFNWLAYLHLLRFLLTLSQSQRAKVILSQGLIRLMPSESVAIQLLELAKQLGINQWLTPTRHFSQTHRAIEFPCSAALDIKQVCQLMIAQIPDSLIQLRLETNIETLRFEQDRWVLESGDSSDSFEQVVFCGGAHSPILDALGITATNTTRGQTCYFEHALLGEKITQPISEKIYLVPRGDSHFHLGTTFEEFKEDSLNPNSQNDMLSRLNHCLTALELPPLTAEEKQAIPLNGTLGYRLHTQDRLPLVGPAVDLVKLQSDFHLLGQRKIEQQALTQYDRPGLWLNTAYGSHGLLFAVLASEHISSLICNDIAPLETAVSQCLSPVRFNIKACRH